MHSLHTGGCQGSPAGLMTCACSSSGVTTEVLAKDNEVSPMRVVDVAAFVTVRWASILGIPQEESDQPAGNLLLHLLKRKHGATSTRTLDPEAFAIDRVVALQSIQKQDVHREPYGSSPVAVAAEHATVALGRH